MISNASLCVMDAVYALYKGPQPCPSGSSWNIDSIMFFIKSLYDIKKMWRNRKYQINYFLVLNYEALHEMYKFQDVTFLFMLYAPGMNKSPLQGQVLHEI